MCRVSSICLPRASVSHVRWPSEGLPGPQKATESSHLANCAQTQKDSELIPFGQAWQWGLNICLYVPLNGTLALWQASKPLVLG